MRGLYQPPSLKFGTADESRLRLNLRLKMTKGLTPVEGSGLLLEAGCTTLPWSGLDLRMRGYDLAGGFSTLIAEMP